MQTVFDTNTAASMGVIGILPLLANVLAQSGNGLAPDMSPWANLAAVGVIIGLFAWLLLYHIPSREKSAEERQDARDARSEQRFDKIQEQFIVALKFRDETSRINAESGHNALSKLLDSQREVVESNKDMIAKLHDVTTKQNEVCMRLERLKS